MEDTMWINFDDKPSVGVRVRGSDAPEQLIEDGWFEVPAALAKQVWNYAHAMSKKVEEAREGRA